MRLFLAIMNHIPVSILLFFSAAWVVLGDYFAKYWSTNQRTAFFLFSVLSYMGSSLFYIPALLREGLIVSSIIWSLLSTVGFLVIGLVIFKETVTTMQTVGIAFGFASLLILSVSR